MADKKESIDVQGTNLTEQIFQHIRNDILRGRYEQGESITELGLSKELSVSRTPVREAIKQLDKEGLVELRPNRGAVVIGIDKNDIEDIYEIRSLLEGRAAERATKNAEDDDIEELKEIVDLTEFYIDRNDYERVIAMDDRFHKRIYRLTGSRIMERVMGELHSYAEKTRQQSIREPGRAKKMLVEHRDILEAIEKGDAKKAGKLMLLHVANVVKNVEENHLI